jgi:hypothetical protein
LDHAPFPIPLSQAVDGIHPIPYPRDLHILYRDRIGLCPQTLEFCSVAIGTASGVEYVAHANRITVPEPEVARMVADLRVFADAIERAG